MTNGLNHRFARKMVDPWDSLSAVGQSIYKENCLPAVPVPTVNASCSGLHAKSTESIYWERGIFQRATRELSVWIPFIFHRCQSDELHLQVHFPFQLWYRENAPLRGICPLASWSEGAKSNFSRVYQADGQGTSTELSQESQHCYPKPVLSFDFENMFFLRRRNIR